MIPAISSLGAGGSVYIKLLRIIIDEFLSVKSLIYFIWWPFTSYNKSEIFYYNFFFIGIYSIQYVYLIFCKSIVCNSTSSHRSVLPYRMVYSNILFYSLIYSGPSFQVLIVANNKGAQGLVTTLDVAAKIFSPKISYIRVFAKRRLFQFSWKRARIFAKTE